MTATWTKALGFLSLPEATRSLQATEKKEGREEKMREQETRRDQGGEGEDENQDEGGDNTHTHDPSVSHITQHWVTNGECDNR